jgi:hypothetical protein
MLRSCSRTAVDPLPALTTNNQFPGQPSCLLRIPAAATGPHLPPDQAPFFALQRRAAALPRPTSFHLPSITYPMLHEPTPEHLPNLRTDRVSPPPPGPKHRPRVLPKSDRQQSSPGCTDRSQLRSSPTMEITYIQTIAHQPPLSWLAHPTTISALELRLPVLRSDRPYPQSPPPGQQPLLRPALAQIP